MSDVQTPANDLAPPTRPNLSRPAAVAWFAEQGFDHVTVEYLEKAAARGAGPKQFRVGKYVYYSREALLTWLAAEIGRSLEGSRANRRRGQAILR
jgi:hypothetical protein